MKKISNLKLLVRMKKIICDFNSLNISKLDIFNKFNSDKEKEAVLYKSIKEQKKTNR